MEKKQVAAILEEMGTLLELQGANPFKVRAFQNASRAVEGLTKALPELVQSGELLEVRGIGKSIASIIAELVMEGRSKEHEALREKVPKGLLEMLGIQGMGPKRIKLLYEKMNIRTIADLEAAAKGDRLSVLDGFGKKTQENILRGIAALRSRAKKTLYPKAHEAAQALLSYLSEQRGIQRIAVAGSLRRRKELIGDIDIVASVKENARPGLMDAFVTHPSVQSVVARGDTKSSVVLESGINCDLRIISDGEYPFALNYFTGSKEHNIEMRTRAKKFGWSLNEYGFSSIETDGKRRKEKRPPACKNEAELYRALGLEYIPPELRENMGEFEAAERGTLPRLVEFSDIRGTFHCHTSYSDGANTVAEMAQAAKRLGWEYLGIADHSKAAAYAGGLSAEKVKAQLKEIDALNDSMKGLRILKGTECDILPNGDLDWPDKILASFEYVVVSIHSGFRMTEAEMTKRIVKALKNKYVTMLGHPTGRLLLARDAYPVDMVQVIDAAAEYGKTIEINAHPTRLDLDWRQCRYAKKKGLAIAINPDAHTVEGLRDVAYGVGVARKGWLEKKDVLNTFSLNAVLRTFHH
jgi:DNA polymerase (family 10)